MSSSVVELSQKSQPRTLSTTDEAHTLLVKPVVMAESATDDQTSEKPLGERCIRLLRLNAVDRRNDSALRGSLKVASLDRNPSFSALSYTWGLDASSPSRHIICSGETIPITQNCHDALSTLRRTFKVRTIWVDAICINQNDDREKGSQIPLMRDIFGKANRVYIWIGNGTAESDEAIEWMRHATRNINVLMPRIKSFPGSMAPSELRKIWISLPALFEKYHLRHKVAPAYNSYAMQDIIGRDWFGRMWTLQEVVMANEPLAVCGSKSIRWVNLNWSIIRARELPGNKTRDAFTKVFNSVLAAESFWLDQSHKYLSTKGSVRNWVQGDGILTASWHYILDLLESRDQLVGKVQDGLILAFIIIRLLLGQPPFKSWWLFFIVITRIVTRVITPQFPVPPPGKMLHWEVSLRAKLPGVMNKIRSRDAKLPVDKVFALYGIFEELEIPIQGADYTKSTSQVYLEFTCDLIRWHKCLEFLTEASMPTIPGAPSWVPDWSRSHSRICVGYFKAAGDSLPIFRFAKRPASNGSAESSGAHDDEWTVEDFRRDPDDLPSIVTKGLIVDYVEFCLPPLQHEDNSNENSSFLANFNNLRHWLSVCQTLQSNDALGHTNIEEFFNILHAGYVLSPKERSENELFTAWISLLYSPLPLVDNLSPSEAGLYILSLPDNEALYHYHTGRINALAGKRNLFTTKKARLGTGPLKMQVGDVVALFSGFSCPMILRQSKEINIYEVVGVAYIEGMMQGEAWRESEEKVRDLVLV